MLQPWDDPLNRAGPDYNTCRAMIRQGSRSFYMASLLLPMAVRMPACAIYAFCRVSDDAVDGPDARRDAIALLHDRLDRAYAGSPLPFPADRAFADVVHRHAIPKALPLALLDGLAFDAEGRHCETLSDLYAYAARVAAAVGAMMTVLMGVRDPATLARACDLGVAMQLTNIARDIGEDARNGRIYLPRDWLRDVGLNPEQLLERPVFDERLRALIARLLDHAEELYERSASGIIGLPLSCRPAIHSARLIYREIGEQVRRNGYDSVSQRAFVPDSRKIALLGAALGATRLSGTVSAHPPLAETAFLVDSIPRGHQALSRGLVSAVLYRPVESVIRFDRRLGRMLELMSRVDSREEFMANGRE